MGRSGDGKQNILWGWSLVNSLRLQTVTRLVPLLVFMKSLCACQFSKFSKAVNSYNIACHEVNLC